MRTLHVISHTHWDREWYRTFQQFRLRLVHLIDGLLEILDKDPEYKHFMLDGQTIVLDDYLHMRPEKEETLQKHIQSGRILIGPWHILPDMFLVGPEAHIRNLLQGERTARRFGSKMLVGYIPDPFGHPAQTPQILRGFGMDTACVWRGLDEQPAEFWWQSADGSRVLMAYMRDSYSNGSSLSANNPPAFAQEILTLGESLAAHSAANEFLIMYGTDHMEPDPNTATAIFHANQTLQDWQVIHSTLPAYFEAIQKSVDLKKLPVLQGELRACKRMHLLPGVLSTRMWIKQRNRACENLLTRWVEPLSTFSGLLDQEEGLENAPANYLQQPAGIIRQAWRLLMENHPHDSICGCSLDQVHDEMKPRFDQVDQIGEELTRQRLERLAGSMDTQVGKVDGLATIVVFNPLPFERSENVQVEITLPPNASGFEILDEQGQKLSYKTLGLGTQDLVNARMSPAELRSGFGMIHEGRAMGMGVQSLSIQRKGEEAAIEVTFSQAEPNQAVWEECKRQIQEALADNSLKGFQVRARTADLVQAIFFAPGVPGLGWKSFTVCLKEGHKQPIPLPKLARILIPLAAPITNTRLGEALIARLQRDPTNQPPYVIENEFFKVAVEQNGTLDITDQRDGRIYRGLNRFVDGGDCGDTYNYSPPVQDALIEARLKKVSVQRSVVQQTLMIEMSLDTPERLTPDRQARSSERVAIPVQTNVTLMPGLARIDIHTEVENCAYDHRLRVHFPTPFQVQQVRYDGHFIIDERPVGVPEFDRQSWVEDPRPEVPQRAFAQVTAAEGGFILANRGLPEIEALQTPQGIELALTLLRCVGWLSRDDYVTRRGNAGTTLATPGAQMIGRWHFDYAISPQPANDPMPPQKIAYAFETPMRAICTTLHPGNLPGTGSYLQVEATSQAHPDQPAEFIVSAIKEAEDSSGWLVRGYNPGPEPSRLTLKPLFRCRSAALANLAEHRLTELKLERDTGTVTVDVGGYQIVTVIFL